MDTGPQGGGVLGFFGAGLDQLLQTWPATETFLALISDLNKIPGDLWLSPSKPFAPQNGEERKG